MLKIISFSIELARKASEDKFTYLPSDAVSNEKTIGFFIDFFSKVCYNGIIGAENA